MKTDENNPSQLGTLAIKPEIWRYVFDASNDLVFLHDARFRILKANRAYCHAAGKTEAEALGKPYWEVFPPADGPLPDCKAALESRDRGDSEEEFSVGKKRFLSKSYIGRDDHGEVLYGLHILSDITVQKHTETTLAESEERLRYAIDAARDAIITIDGAGAAISAWNPAAESVFGYSREEAIGRDVHEILPTLVLGDPALANTADFATSGAGPMIGKTLELPARRKNGTDFFVELSLSAMQIRDKWYATAIARDITERKLAHASEERYRRLFESAKDGILILDAKTGMIVDANPFITELLGYSLDDIREKYIWDMGFLKNVAANKEKFEELQRQDYVRYDDLPLETALGKTIHVEFVSNVYLVGNTKVIQCNIRDITRRWQAEEKNLRLSQMYRTISRCNETLVRATDELALAHAMCKVLTDEGKFRMAWVGYAEHGADKRIRTIAATEADQTYLESLKLTWADEQHDPMPANTAIRTGQAAVCHDIRSAATGVADQELAAAHGYVTVAAIPLKFDPHGLGVLVVYGATANEFSEDIISLLTELADDLAFGISTLRAKAERMGILEKLEHSLDHAVTAIAATVEMRDPYTAGHQRRVAKLAAAIAVEMGVVEDHVKGLHMASVVHDIGKIHVPAEILSSPAKLSDAEFEIIKTHPKIGWEILKGIDFPWPVAEMVYQHHEKLDGSGYPRGLKGEEILLEARILTVADVVEAMTSHRPYRPGFGVFPALQEISRQKGKLYDAAVVEACLRIFMDKNYEL